MTRVKEEKPLTEMSRSELEREIGKRTKRYDFAVDVRIGVAIVTAFAIGQNSSIIVRSGYPPEDVLLSVLHTLCRLSWPNAPTYR